MSSTVRVDRSGRRRHLKCRKLAERRTGGKSGERRNADETWVTLSASCYFAQDVTATSVIPRLTPQTPQETNF